MLSRTILNRLIILGFISLIGFCLAKAIYHQSIMGVILAVVSLGATVFFLYLVVKANAAIKQQREKSY